VRGRPSMKRIVFSSLIIFGSIPVWGQSLLPLCVAESAEPWDNCVGTEEIPGVGKYTGEWKGGSRAGRGILVFDEGVSKGDEYNGDFREGTFEGKGTYRWADGRVYVGEWRQGKRNGRGIETLPSGAEYSGDFKDGKYHGRGSFAHQGNRYTGDWQNGVADGQGTWMYSNGNRYSGGIRDGQYYGEGTVSASSGRVIVKATWESDKYFKFGDTLFYFAGGRKDAFYFVVPKSIGFEAGARKAWTILAYPSPQKSQSNALSSRMLQEFDCQRGRTRTKSVMLFSGSFAQGEVLASGEMEEWVYVPPGTLIDGVMKYVCSFPMFAIAKNAGEEDFSPDIVEECVKDEYCTKTHAQDLVAFAVRSFCKMTGRVAEDIMTLRQQNWSYERLISEFHTAEVGSAWPLYERFINESFEIQVFGTTSEKQRAIKSFVSRVVGRCLDKSAEAPASPRP